MDKIYRFRTEQIQSFAVGYTPDAQSEAANTILWTVSHNKEENFLVANRATVTSQTASGDTNDATKAQAVGLITVSIPVQFQITNVTDWAYKNNAPDALLKDLATQETIHYFAGVDLNDVLSQGRLQAADSFARPDPSCGECAFAGRENHFRRPAGHSSADGQRRRRDLRKSRRRASRPSSRKSSMRRPAPSA